MSSLHSALRMLSATRSVPTLFSLNPTQPRLITPRSQPPRSQPPPSTSQTHIIESTRPGVIRCDMPSMVSLIRNMFTRKDPTALARREFQCRTCHHRWIAKSKEGFESILRSVGGNPRSYECPHCAFCARNPGLVGKAERCEEQRRRDLRKDERVAREKGWDRG